MLSATIIALTLSWTDVTGHVHMDTYPQATLATCREAAQSFMHQPDGNMTDQTATCGYTEIYVK